MYKSEANHLKHYKIRITFMFFSQIYMHYITYVKTVYIRLCRYEYGSE